MQLFDVSRALRSDLAPWPGDTPFHFELKQKIAESATVNVGAITMSVHNGTHADAVFHFEENGEPIDRMPLDAYIGDAVVVDLTKIFATETNNRKRQIEVADLEASSSSLEQAPRLLIKTGIWNNAKVFPTWFPVLAPDVAEWLRQQRVRLLGLDLPSVDAVEAKQLINHHALAAADIAILESLDLSAIEAGVFHFAALPVKIAGADAAPVRAILWRE